MLLSRNLSFTWLPRKKHLFLAATTFFVVIPVWANAVVFTSNMAPPAPNLGFKHYRIDGNGSIESVTIPVAKGTVRSAKFTVPDDGVSYRSEVACSGFGYGSYTYRFSDYIPSDYTDSSVGNIVAQWHGYPLAATGGDTHPPVLLANQNGQWILRVFWMNSPSATKPVMKSFIIGPAIKGKWNHWEASIAWSTATQPGHISLKLDGKEVVNYTGVNNYGQKWEPYFKVGIYRPEWRPGNHFLAGGTPAVIYDGPVTITRH